MSATSGGTPSAARRARRILVLSQFYPPEPCAAANRVSALAEALAERGHDVTILTGMPNFPAGRIEPGYAGALFRRERCGAVAVERVWTLVRGRLATWASVAFGATVRALFSARYDAIVVSSPPITLALPALVAKLRHRAPLIVDVRDVFPDVAVEMGEWKRDGLLARSVGAIAALLYRTARVVVCVTPSARAEITARAAGSHPLLAPNGFDAIALASEPVLAAEPGAFVAAYVGNMGLATGLDVVLDAAVQLTGDPRFRFVLVGAGADAERLARRIADEGLHNVRMLGVLPRPVALRVVADADVCLVPLRNTITDSLPTKLFDAMFVSRPAIVSAGGEARRVLEESGGGIAVPPGDGAALAGALRTLAADPALCARMGASGNTYVNEHYDRARIMRALAAQIELAAAAQPALRAST